PAVAAAREHAPLVQAMLARRPELDPVGNDAIAAPGGGPGHILPREPLLGLVEATLEGRPAVERARLVGRPGAELRIPAPRGEVGIGFRVGGTLDPALDADLAAQGFPVEQQRGARILR